jgi:hypothetical protein
LLEAAGQTLACRYNGHLIGFLLFAWLDGSKTALVIQNVFVHPAFREGFALCAMFEALFDEEDPTCRMVLGVVDPSNRAALTAGRTFGFRYLPHRRYSLVSYIPLLLQNPVVLDFFRCRHLDPSAYPDYLQRTPLRRLGPYGDEETWDGRSVCTYRFAAGHDVLEVVIDLQSNSITALHSPEFSCGLRIGGARRFDVDDVLAYVDLGNPTVTAVDGTVVWGDSAAPASSTARRFQLAPGCQASLHFHTYDVARSGRHRSAAIVCAGDYRLELTASYRLERAVALIGRQTPQETYAVTLLNRTSGLLCLAIHGPEHAEQFVSLAAGVSRTFWIDGQETISCSPTHKPQLRYTFSPPGSYHATVPQIYAIDDNIVLEGAGSKAVYDAPRDRLMFYSSTAGRECVRQTWTGLGPPYWTYERGTAWSDMQVEMHADRHELVVTRMSRDAPARLQKSVRLRPDGGFDIAYQLVAAEGKRCATLFEFLLPAPVVTYLGEHGITRFVPVPGEVPHRLQPVRPSQPWVQVDNGDYEVRLEWSGGDGDVFADSKFLKVWLEFTAHHGVLVRLSCRALPPCSVRMVQWSKPLVMCGNSGGGWLSAMAGVDTVKLVPPDGWSVNPDTLAAHVPTRICLQTRDQLEPGVRVLAARGEDRSETLVPCLVLARPASLRVQSRTDSISIDNGVLRLELAQDVRGPLLALSGLEQAWIACSYPDFHPQGHDPECCGGLALRISSNPDAVLPKAWVRDFSTPRGADKAMMEPWEGVVSVGSLTAIGLPDVQVCRQILTVPGSTLVWIVTSIENRGDEQARFSLSNILTPSHAEHPAFRMYGWTGLGCFERQRTHHETIAISRSAAVCGIPGAWMAYIAPGNEVAGHDQARFGFRLEARACPMLEPGERSLVHLFLVVGQRLDEVCAAAEALVGAQDVHNCLSTYPGLLSP